MFFVGQTAHQQVFAKQIHHLVVGGFVQSLQLLKLPADSRNRRRIHAVGVQKLLKVQRKHLHPADAAHWDGGGLRQSDPQQGTAGHIGEFSILGEEFQQRQQMGICLDFVQKNQSVGLLLHLVARKHTDPKIKVFYRPCLCKQAGAYGVLHHVELNKVWKQPFPHIADNIGLADLTGAIDQKDLVRA